METIVLNIYQEIPNLNKDLRWGILLGEEDFINSFSDYVAFVTRLFEQYNSELSYIQITQQIREHDLIYLYDQISKFILQFDPKTFSNMIVTKDEKTITFKLNITFNF